jgi:hypothetical protein
LEWRVFLLDDGRQGETKKPKWKNEPELKVVPQRDKNSENIHLVPRGTDCTDVACN